MGRLLRALAAAVITAASAAPAAAAEPAPVIVLWAPAPTAGAEKAAGALHDVARRRATTVIDLTPPGDPAPSASRLLARAIDAYQSFELDAALTGLETALAEAAATGARGLGATELSDLYLYRGLVHHQRGDETQSWDDFVRAATIDPTRRLDPVRFPPRAVESFQRAAAAVAAGDRTALTIDAGDRCSARVDAREVAVGAPVSLAAGDHYLRIECPGQRPDARLLRLGAGEQTVRPVADHVAPPQRDEVVAVARRRGATTVLYARVAADDAASTITLAVIETETGDVRDQVVAPLDDTSRAELADAADRLVARVIAPPEIDLVAPPRERRWYENPWLWGAVGVAVTAAVLIPFTVDRGPRDGFDVRPGGALDR